ncbi:MAG: hypothetical protein ABIH03_15865 [Pseudomonadota bacterium]
MSAKLYGCCIGESSLIGINGVILNNVVIGKHTLIGAGSLIPEGKSIPDGVRDLSQAEIGRLRRTADGYMRRAKLFREQAATAPSRQDCALRAAGGTFAQVRSLRLDLV